MRKLIMLTACIGMLGFMVPDSVWAGCNGPVTISFHGNQDPDDDEFLYTSMTQFNLANAGYENSGNKNSGDGKVYECDEVNSGGCTAGSVVTMNKGHVFKGKVVNRKAKYKCIAGFDDYWIEVEDGLFCDTKGFGKINVGGCVPSGKGGCRVLTPAECSGYSKTDNNATGFVGICRGGPNFVCRAENCPNGMIVNEHYKCVAKNNDAPGTIVCPAGSDLYDRVKNSAECKIASAVFECTLTSLTTKKCLCGRCVTKAHGDGNGGGNVGGGSGGGAKRTIGDGSSLNRCLAETRRQGNEKALACCYLSGKVAVYDATDGCKCLDTKMEFRMTDGGRGGCFPKADQVDKVKAECETDKAKQSGAEWDANAKQCKCKDAATQEFVDGVCQDKEDVAECKLVNGAEWKDGKCVCKEKGMVPNYAERRCVADSQAGGVQVAVDLEVQLKQKIATSRSRIIAAGKVLDSISAQFKTSVWKNKDGGFNTARLASDSIAGVVLGTAGGLITSNVIKKNQIKGGFEDIKCTIGGQVVSDWGDDFQVGIGLNGNY